MQEEATQRVREMQRRAQLTAQRAQEELEEKNTGKQTDHSGRPQSAQESPRRQEKERPAPTARPRPHNHISMPVDYIHEKQDTPQGACTEPIPPVTALEKAAGQEACGPKPAQPTGSDQSLLLALMLLLGGESTDELLLLALLYIMM